MLFIISDAVLERFWVPLAPDELIFKLKRVVAIFWHRRVDLRWIMLEELRFFFGYYRNFSPENMICIFISKIHWWLLSCPPLWSNMRIKFFWVHQLEKQSRHFHFCYEIVKMKLLLIFYLFQYIWKERLLKWLKFRFSDYRFFFDFSTWTKCSVVPSSILVFECWK